MEIEYIVKACLIIHKMINVSSGYEEKKQSFDKETLH